VIGFLLRGVGALPVFRKSDGANTSKNDGTLTASISALVEGRAITLFPEGKSHSEPQLAELKTGCARIALQAQSQGASVAIVPLGLTYEAKQYFRSAVHIEVGAPVEVSTFATQAGAVDVDAVQRLTDAVAEALQAVTLNVEHWEDVTLLKTAEALYALRAGDEAGLAERQRAFARGMQVLRAEEPTLFDELKVQISSFARRLALVDAKPGDLSVRYQPGAVVRFVLRNLAWLLALPFFMLGMGVFVLPYYFPQLVAAIMKPEDDVLSTVKMLAAMVIAPLWWLLLTGLGFWWLGPVGGVVTFALVPVLALVTRVFYERRGQALRDARLFFSFWGRSALKKRLLSEGLALAGRIDSVVGRLAPRIG
jgi:glycerol-3-phosphate O-acyltransferase / dihydroxyacetone phosphate acyltransferase